MNRSIGTLGLALVGVFPALACLNAPGQPSVLVMFSATPSVSPTPSGTPSGGQASPSATETSQPAPSPAAAEGEAVGGTTTPGFPDLNGAWEDNGRAIVIVQNGFQVSGTCIEERVCDHRDGQGTTARYRYDFNARLSQEGDGWILASDEFGVCGYEHDDPARNGLVMTEARAVVSEDINTICGNWYHDDPSDGVVGGVQIVHQFEAGAALPTLPGFSLPTAPP